MRRKLTPNSNSDQLEDLIRLVQAEVMTVRKALRYKWLLRLPWNTALARARTLETQWTMRDLSTTNYRMPSAAFNAYTDVFLELERLEDNLRKAYAMSTPEEKDKLWHKHQVILDMKAYITKRLDP